MAGDLSIAAIGNETVYFEFLDGIGNHMSELIYLKIEVYAHVYSWPEALCNLKHTLTFLYFRVHLFTNIDDCIGEFEQLTYFFASIGPITYFPSSLFNLSKIRIISFDSNELEWDAMIDIFYTSNNNSSQFSGYSNSLVHVYFQNNDFCHDGSIESALSDNVYTELVSFINLYDACSASCDNFSQILHFNCLPYAVGNGVCDTACNLEDCGFDGGDCQQNCDFESCNVTNWSDGICDQECNSTQCLLDGYDCSSTIQCSNNSLCEYPLLNDGYCHLFCVNETNEICRQVEISTDCYGECPGDSTDGCLFAYNLFSFGSGGDEIIDPDNDDICQIVDLIVQYLGISHEVDTDDLLANAVANCSNIFYNPAYDYNTNGKLGFWETILIFGIVRGDSNQVSQGIDCSVCMLNSSLYYV